MFYQMEHAEGRSVGMMDSNLQHSPPDSIDTKRAFRKPSGDAANRNYRRRSPVDGSPSSDGSPNLERNASPNPSREDSVKVSDHHYRKDDGGEQERRYGRSHYGRSSHSYRHSDRQSSRSSYGHSRHEDYIRQDKYADEDRYRERLSSHSGHESRGERTREESENRSKDYLRSVDKYSHDRHDKSDHRNKKKDRETFSLEHKKYRDKDSSCDRSGSSRRHAASDKVERERHARDWDGQDERRNSRRSSGDYRSDREHSYSESRSQRDDSGSTRDSGKRCLKEAYKSEQKELDDQKIPWGEKKKYDDIEICRNKDQNVIKVEEQFGNEDKESSAKKMKLFGVNEDNNRRNNDERQTSSSKIPKDSNLDLGNAHASGSESSGDLNAAKVAAMKAAELVNRNLVGAGCLTTDQKKKLLWGGKKNTTTEESGHRWDTALFSDRERQEKFNKLMSLRLNWCLWPIVGCERRFQSGAKFQQPTWQQSSCGETEGTPAGSRETVHCRSATKRWSYSWIRSLNIYLGYFSSFDVCNVLKFDAHLLWKVFVLVCFLHLWGIIYVLLSDTLSLGSWWDLIVGQKQINIIENPCCGCITIFKHCF